MALCRNYVACKCRDLGYSHLLEDAQQAVLLSLLLKPPPETADRALLGHICKRRAQDWLRGYTRSRRATRMEPLGTRTFPVQETQERTAEARQMLNRIRDPRSRDILYRKYVLEETWTEIAAATGVRDAHGVGHRALSALRKQIA